MNSKIANASFVMHTDVLEILEELTDEQAGQLFRAILQYAHTGEQVEMSSVLRLAFIPIKQRMDYNSERYEEVKKKRAEAGKKGAEKRWGNGKITNANFVKNENGKNGYIDIDTVIDTDTDIVLDNSNNSNKPKNKNKQTGDVISELPEELHETVDAFIEHRKKLKRPLTAHSLGLILSKANKLAEGDTERVKAIIEQSMERGWVGVFDLDDKKQKTSEWERAWHELENQKEQIDERVDTSG